MKIKRFTVILIAVGFATTSLFVKLLQPGDIPPLEYANRLRLQDLEFHVRYLASDSLEGRKTGTKGDKKAALYLASQWAQYDVPPLLENSYFQTFNLVTPEMPSVSISTDYHSYAIGKDFVSFFPHDSAIISDDHIVYVGYGIDDPSWNDYAYKDVKGKIILVKAGEPLDQFGNSILSATDRRTVWSRDPVHAYILKRQAALKHGAKAMLYYDPKHYKAFKQAFERMFQSSKKTSEIKVDSLYDFIIGKDLMTDLTGYDSLDDIYYTGRKDRKMTVPVTIYYHKKGDILSTQNLLAVIRGEQYPDQYVLVLANYDHLGKIRNTIYPGANNNATGTSAVVEISHLFRMADKDGFTPKRSIIFALFSGREEKHLGARYFIKHPPVPLENITAVVDIDMIGYVDTISSHPNNLYYAENLDYKDFMEKMEALNRLGPKLTLKHISSFARYGDLETASDGYFFYKKNIPWISFVNGGYPYNRTPDDTPDKITWDVFTERVKFIFMATWRLAND